MSMTDPIADLLTRIRNGQKAEKESVAIPFSKLKENILKVLVEEGYVRGYRIEAEGVQKTLMVDLAYYAGRPVIEVIQRSSRPGLRNYSGKDTLPKVRDGYGIAIVSTSKGVMTDRAARALGVGGEVLCLVA